MRLTVECTIRTPVIQKVEGNDHRQGEVEQDVRRLGEDRDGIVQDQRAARAQLLRGVAEFCVNIGVDPMLIQPGLGTEARRSV